MQDISSDEANISEYWKRVALPIELVRLKLRVGEASLQQEMRDQINRAEAMRDTLEQMNKNVSQMKTSQQGETDAAQASARTALAEEVGAAQNSMAAADRSLREGWANADRIFDYLKGQVQHFALVLDSGDHGTYSALNGGREDANAVMLESHGLSHWMDTHLDAEVFSTSKLIEALDGWADKFAEDERDAEMQSREAEYRSAARTNEFITQMASGLGGAQQSKPQSQETPGGNKE